MYRTIIPIVLVVVILVLVTVALSAWQFVSIKSTGTPLGSAMRLPNHIAQIIVTTESYLPTLHRNPGKDRFRLDLLVISIADPTQQRTITLLRQQQANALQPITKILGGTGNVVWVQALDLFAVNLETTRVANSADIVKLNPELSLFLASARCEFKDQLIVVSPDQQQAYAIDASNEWYGVLPAKDLASDFKPGFRAPLDSPFNPANELRQLYRGHLDGSAPRPRIEAMEAISEKSYRNGALVRGVQGAGLLRLASPDGVLLTHRASAALNAPLMVTRLTPEGKNVWTTDTGIGRLEQVLPDKKVIAFIGVRPTVPDKVAEPILVLVNTGNGEMTTHSLWR